MAVSVVVIGTSLGGLSALKVILSGLRTDFRPPIVVSQHRGKAADDVLVSLLAKETSLSVSEPNDKEVPQSGHVYIAPADYHLCVEPGSLVLSTEAPVNHARPSIDVLFESAAESYRAGVVGVVLTGANHDGARGCAHIKQRGGIVVVQDPATAEASALPAAAIAAARVDKVVRLSEVAAVLYDLSRDTRS